MDRMVALSRGPTPVPAYLDEMLIDVTVHSWDLGTADQRCWIRFPRSGGSTSSGS